MLPSWLAVGAVALEPLAQGREDEGLEEVLHDPERHRRPHDLEVAGRGDGDDVGPVAGRPHGPDDVETVPVGQVHVEQDDVDRHRLQRAQRVGGRWPPSPPPRSPARGRRMPRAPRARPARPRRRGRAAVPGRAVSHRRAPRTRPPSRQQSVAGSRGSRTVKQAPGGPVTSIRPPSLATDWATRASPMPRRPGCPAPWWRTRAGTPGRPRPGAGPGPESATRSTTSSPVHPRVDLDPARGVARGVGHGVEGVVDEVADDGHDVTHRGGVRGPARRPPRSEKSMPRSRGLGGLAEQQRGQRRLGDGADHARRSAAARPAARRSRRPGRARGARAR